MEIYLLKVQAYIRVSSGLKSIKNNSQMIDSRLLRVDGRSRLQSVFFVALFWLCNLNMNNGFLLMLRL